MSRPGRPDGGLDWPDGLWHDSGVAHVELGNQLPGIRGLLAYRPETAGPLMELAQVLLRGDSTPVARASGS